MLTNADVTGNIVLSGLAGSLVPMFTAYKALYPEVRDGRNVHAILSKSSYTSFKENIAVKHLKDNIESFYRTGDAVKDLSRECFGRITATCVKMPITADAIISYALANNADVIYIEDITAYDSDAIRLLVEKADERGFRLVMNSVFKAKTMCSKYPLDTKGILSWYKNLYGDLTEHVKICIAYLEEFKGQYWLFNLEDDSIRLYDMTRLFE